MQSRYVVILCCFFRVYVVSLDFMMINVIFICSMNFPMFDGFSYVQWIHSCSMYSRIFNGFIHVQCILVYSMDSFMFNVFSYIQWILLYSMNSWCSMKFPMFKEFLHVRWILDVQWNFPCSKNFSCSKNFFMFNGISHVQWNFFMFNGISSCSMEFLMFKEFLHVQRILRCSLNSIRNQRIWFVSSCKRSLRFHLPSMFKLLQSIRNSSPKSTHRVTLSKFYSHKDMWIITLWNLRSSLDHLF